MFDNTATRQESQPRFWNLVALVYTPWLMLADFVNARQTRAILSRLDDHLLKDIGLTRGNIDSAIRGGLRRD